MIYRDAAKGNKGENVKYDCKGEREEPFTAFIQVYAGDNFSEYKNGDHQ